MRVPPGGGFKTPAMDRPVKCHSDNPVPGGKIPSEKIPDLLKTPRKLLSDNPLPPKFPDVKLPDVKLPDVKLPDVKLPDVKLPELPNGKIPEINLPDGGKVKCHADLPWKGDLGVGRPSTDSFEPAAGTRLGKKD